MYLLAQQSPGTYLNDVTSGNNDYNATDGGQYPAMAGYDMATGLGTPVASELAAGLTGIPLTVVVSGSQPYGGSPTFTASADDAGSGSAPFGVTLDTAALSCTTVGSSTAIGPSLALGQYTLQASSCAGLTLSGADGADYSVVYTNTPNDFTVTPGPVDVAVSGSQTYGGTPSFSGTDTPPPGVTVNTAGVSCTQAGTSAIAPTLPAGSYALAASSCSGATLSGTNAPDYTVVYTSAAGRLRGDQGPADCDRFEHLHDLRRHGADDHGVVFGLRQWRHFVVPHDQTDLLDHGHQCEPGAGKPVRDVVRRSRRPELRHQLLRGLGDGQHRHADHHRRESDHDLRRDGADHHRRLLGVQERRHGVVADTAPTCSTTATSASTVAGSPYQTFCSGAADSNYTIGYVTGALTVSKAPLTITASSGSMTYGGTVPTITPIYAGFVNGDTASSLTTQPTCSTTATSSSPVVGLSLCLLVQRSHGPQLHHRAGERLGDGGQGPAHDHRLERLHDLRRDGADDHAGVLGLRQR